MIKSDAQLKKEVIESAMATLEHEVIPMMINRAKQNCPVRSGALRDSIDYARQNKQVFNIYTDTDNGYGSGYGAFVEFGTSRNSAQPFLGPAILSMI
jgi:HK97 gp10 family phage protein